MGSAAGAAVHREARGQAPSPARHPTSSPPPPPPSLEGGVFDRLGRGFAYHTTHEHDVNAYLSLLAYLQLKDPQYFTGLESSVAAAVRAGTLAWLPVGRATIHA